MTRAALILLAGAVLSPAWVESVEFPWERYPRELWEQELVRLHNLGATHISLQQGSDAAGLAEVVRILRRLNLEGDLEGPIPAELESLTRAHGGPLTAFLPGPVERVSVLRPDAVTHSRTLLGSGAPSLLWTDLEDTLDASGYRAGAVNFMGAERPAAVAVRRALRISRYWGSRFPLLREAPGVGLQTPAEGVTVRQFSDEAGASVVSIVNRSAKTFAGDVRVAYPALKRNLGIPGIKVAAGDALWLPVSVPLVAGAMCRDCVAFAAVDHLVYSTVELTAMEFENGILAMEFYAPVAGEAVLQVSRQPAGPLVAGGRLSAFDWDERTQRVRIPIPAGSGAGRQVRVGLAIEPPDSTAFFDAAGVLMIGEQNRLTARFSSAEIADRSRLRIAPDLAFQQAALPEATQPGVPRLEYRIAVPAGSIHGERAELTIEADGRRISHAGPTLLRPVTLRFPEAIEIPLAADAALPLFPPTIPVNRRQGRDVAISLHNNAPAIRTFRVELQGEGLEFSPAVREVSIGIAATRDVTFRVFAAEAAERMHAGELKISGDAMISEAIRFLVLGNDATRIDSGPFRLMENGRFRAVFLPGRWLQFLNKESGKDALPAGGITFDTAKFAQDNVRLEDLPAMIPKPKN